MATHGTPINRGGDVRATLYQRYRSSFKGPPASAEPVFAWWDHKYLPLLRGVAAAAPILDLGCGDGRLLAYLRQRGFSNAMGIDVSAEQVAAARQRGVPAEQADAFSWLEQHPAQYEVLVAVDVFEHLQREELLRLAPLITRALRHGGRLLVQTANGAGLLAGQVLYGDLTHLTIFTPDSLAQLLRPFGFTQLSCYETGPAPIRLRGKLDWALWQGIKLAANTVRSVQAGKRQAIWTDTFICLARVP